MIVKIKIYDGIINWVYIWHNHFSLILSMVWVVQLFMKGDIHVLQVFKLSRRGY